MNSNDIPLVIVSTCIIVVLVWAIRKYRDTLRERQIYKNSFNALSMKLDLEERKGAFLQDKLILGERNQPLLIERIFIIINQLVGLQRVS